MQFSVWTYRFCHWRKLSIFYWIWDHGNFFSIFPLWNPLLIICSQTTAQLLCCWTQQQGCLSSGSSCSGCEIRDTSTQGVWLLTLMKTHWCSVFARWSGVGNVDEGKAAVTVGWRSETWFWGLWEVFVQDRVGWVGTGRAAAPLAAGMSYRCCRWSTRLLKQRVFWTAVPGHLTDGLSFSVFHTDSSDKGLVHSKKFREPSSFHPPPPELSSKNFLQEKHSYGVSYSAILSLSFHVPLEDWSHRGLSKPLLSSAYPWFVFFVNKFVTANYCFLKPAFLIYLGQTHIRAATWNACDCC